MSKDLTVEVLNARVKQLQQEVEDTNAHTARVLRFLSPELKDVDHDDATGITTMSMSVPRQFVQTMAVGMIEMYDDSRAQNFVSINVEHPERGAFELIIQRRGGKTPAEMRSDAIDDLYATALALRALGGCEPERVE